MSYGIRVTKGPTCSKITKIYRSRKECIKVYKDDGVKISQSNVTDVLVLSLTKYWEIRISENIKDWHFKRH